MTSADGFTDFKDRSGAEAQSTPLESEKPSDRLLPAQRAQEGRRPPDALDTPPPPTSGLAVLDNRLRFMATNDAFIGQCGLDWGEIQGRSFAELLNLSVRQGLMSQFERLVQGQRARLAEQPIAFCSTTAAVGGKLTAFRVNDQAGKAKLVVVLVTPEETAGDWQPLAGPQRKLSELDAKILEGVAAGVSTVRLAANLFLSRQGVEYHVAILLRQFRVPNRAALASKAYSMGMFHLGCWPPKVLSDYIASYQQSRPARR